MGADLPVGRLVLRRARRSQRSDRRQLARCDEGVATTGRPLAGSAASGESGGVEGRSGGGHLRCVARAPGGLSAATHLPERAVALEPAGWLADRASGGGTASAAWHRRAEASGAEPLAWHRRVRRYRDR